MCSAARPYALSPLFPTWGMEVQGIDLKQPVSQETIEAIREDVTKHRLLIFRNQGVVSGERHVEISNWFGPCESTFYKHPRSPHPDVFRVSNDRLEGCTGVGRTGWHIDGSFQTAPFSYALYHIVSCPTKGDTVFAPLHEVVGSLPAEQRARWDRLWMLSDRRARDAKPLLYQHPLTGQDALCFHLGMTEAFVWDLGTPKQQATIRDSVTTPPEAVELLREIEEVFTKTAAHLIYHHKWQPGDFLISDNLALGHEADPDTQLPPSEVGLRVMHRTTVQGQYAPRKQEDPRFQRHALQGDDEQQQQGQQQQAAAAGGGQPCC
ncbi:dioxygenase Mb0100 isoform D [Chlorella sorokiniana]|uniref:Dioxygenase Mb0100 isoform C n=1 Tax=Chlorella sorokiniana TaxID=3076 RepID=A0A2P6TD18_CHLSO|nr:dioxygenase Mb0100 isoform C [Chlorella sorokiniana]PRW20544.1 dioxygenase Mb0100 isoform D [Chlorella sorokiniana]|eukprot:PRW20542.1 dioxygenase Mb0100 isoform C [Chlorella sorokiniana]